jgi:hypothetical protein
MGDDPAAVKAGVAAEDLAADAVAAGDLVAVSAGAVVEAIQLLGCYESKKFAKKSN